MVPLLFNFLGGFELFIVIMAVMVLFGPKKIPELARTLGKGMRKIRDAREDIQNEIRNTMADPEKEGDVFTREAMDVQKDLKGLKTSIEEEVRKVEKTISRTK
jgi:sec-independent protein translocase protein TatA